MYVVQCKKKYVLKNELTNTTNRHHHSIASLDSNFECVRSPDFINNALLLYPESFKFNRSIDPYPKIFLISALMSTFASESSMKSSISLSYSESLSSLRL